MSLLRCYSPVYKLTSCRKEDTIGKGKKKLKRLEAAIAKRDLERSVPNGMTRLFAYGLLNVHEIQRELWGEAKEGACGRIYDYELKLWPKTQIFYAEPKPGESIAGKVYELTDEQLERTDKFESDAYKRVALKRTGEADVQVYIRNTNKATGE